MATIERLRINNTIMKKNNKTKQNYCCCNVTDVDMCMNNDCEYRCRKAPFGFICTCPPHKKLKPDNKTCEGKYTFVMTLEVLVHTNYQCKR